MHRLGPCIPIFRSGDLIKSAKRMCICEYVKIVLVLIKNGFEKGYKQIIALGSCKIICYLEPCVTLIYFITVVYPEPYHIQNQKHIQNPGIFRTPLYSERWHIQNLRHIQNPVAHLRWSINYFHGYNIFTNCNCFRKACRVEIDILR